MNRYSSWFISTSKFSMCLITYILNKAILATAIKDIRATRLYHQIMSPSRMLTKQCSGHISTILYLGKSHLIATKDHYIRPNMIN
jgi:hypothetical protein